MTACRSLGTPRPFLGTRLLGRRGESYATNGTCSVGQNRGQSSTPTRTECAVTRLSTPTAVEATVNRNRISCADKGTTRPPGSGLVAVRNVRKERAHADLQAPHVVRRAGLDSVCFGFLFHSQFLCRVRRKSSQTAPRTIVSRCRDSTSNIRTAIPVTLQPPWPEKRKTDSAPNPTHPASQPGTPRMNARVATSRRVIVEAPILGNCEAESGSWSSTLQERLPFSSPPPWSVKESSVACLDYVWSFAMFDSGGRLIHWLVFTTNHWKGLFAK